MSSDFVVFIAFCHISIYPVRCAHIPPPCHFSVCSDLLVCLTARVLIFISKVIKFSIIFVAGAVIFAARTVIFEARGAIWTISGRILIFNEKRLFDNLPPPVTKSTLFAVSWGSCFFECSCFWIFVILSAQSPHSGFHFDCFWGALGLSKNSWKCVRVVNFRGLTPLKLSPFLGLGRDGVFQLICYRNLRF